MKNITNTNSSNKNKLLPAIILSTALAQGCATTSEQVKNTLEIPPQDVVTLEAQKLHDKLLLEANSTQNSEAKHEKLVKNTSKSVAVDSDLSPQKTTYLPTVKFQEVFDSLPEIYKTSKSSDLKMNLGVNGVTILNGNSRYNLGYQYSEQFGSILGLEYGYMNGKWGTLATVKIGEEKKSFLLTGVYQGVDWGVKSSVGALFQKFEGKTINQNFAGVEVIRDLSKYIEGLSVKGYANATHTQDKTLSVTEISNKVAGGTEFITTTEEFKGGTNVGGGLGFNYDINDKHSIHGNAGYTSMNGGGSDLGVGYEYRNDKLKLGADYSTRNANEFSADTYGAKLAYIIQPGLTAELTGKIIESDTLDDKQIGVNFTYTPGLKTFDKQGSKISLANLTPVTGANQAMDVLYGKKVTTVDKRFVADKVIDTQAPVLSSTNQSFFTTVGVPLTLATVTANDNIDGALTVTQSGTVDFNTPGTYTVTYTATDAASNASSITHTYVVNAAPVINTAPTSSDATFDMLLVDSTQTFDLAPVIGDAETPVGSLQIVIVSAPTYLTLTQSGTSFSVTPIDSTGHNGNDSFTYKVVDSNGAESPVSTVTILNVSDI